jgi:hypothetical protein
MYFEAVTSDRPMCAVALSPATLGSSPNSKFLLPLHPQTSLKTSSSHGRITQFCCLSSQPLFDPLDSGHAHVPAWVNCDRHCARPSLVRLHFPSAIQICARRPKAYVANTLPMHCTAKQLQPNVETWEHQFLTIQPQ